uniref:Uncharacterized protein n=1 Tax=Solanum tuberosum TaxID=4113 RepID=M1DJV4_SOLTU
MISIAKFGANNTHSQGGDIVTPGIEKNGKCSFWVVGMWTKEQRKETNRQKGTKQAEEVEKSNLGDHQDHSANHQVALQSAKISSVLA